VFLFDLPKLKEENVDFERFMQSPDFWNNTEEAQKISQKLKSNTDTIKEFEDMQGEVEDFELLLELIKEDNDESQTSELNKEMKNIDIALEKLKLKTLLSGEYDRNNAILSIHAGSTGLG